MQALLIEIGEKKLAAARRNRDEMKAIDGVLREEKEGAERGETDIVRPEATSDGEVGNSSGRGRKGRGGRNVSPTKSNSSPAKERESRSSPRPNGHGAGNGPDAKAIEGTIGSRGFRFGPPRAPSPPSSSNNHRLSPSSRRGRAGRPSR